MAFVQNTLSNLPPTTGKVFFVDSGASRASDGNAGRDPNVPLATLDAAVARCTANNGDMIVLMPGHSEATVTAAIAIDVAGVWVYGIGWGQSTPTFTFTGTAGSITMSGYSCRLTNVRCVPGVAACVSPIIVTGCDCIVEDCETVVHATSEFVSLLTVGTLAAGTTACDRVIIRNNRLFSLGATGATSGIIITGADDLVIDGNIIQGHFGEHALDNTTGTLDECLRITISNNIINQMSATAGDLTVELDANCTGMMTNNLMSGGVALDTCVVPGNVRPVQNYLCDADDTHGVEVPTTPSA